MKINKQAIFSLFGWIIICQSAIVIAQVPSPGKLGVRPILIYNAVIHTGTGQVLNNGTVILEKGKIISVSESPGKTISEAEKGKFEVLDAKGHHMYPGFISMNTPLGLNEIDAVRATLDLAETGTENANAHTLPAYNTDSDLIPTIRNNGVLMAQITPRGRRVRGLSALVQLDAWNWEDAAVKPRDGMHLVWPTKYKSSGWWAEPGAIEKNKEPNKDGEELERLFEDAKAYSRSTDKKLNTKLAAVQEVLEGKVILYINAEYASDIVSALQFVERMQIPKVVLVTGSQVLQVLEMVKQRKIPVVLQRIHALPTRPEDNPNLETELPKKLVDAGILCALSYEGDMEIMGSRNLAFLAGSSVRGGLSKEEALQLISLNPAKIMGLEKQFGTIEIGKDATLFLSEGDALDMKSQKLTNAWIQGRPISLDSKQTALYEKFKKMLEQGRN
jgi:imidazolonepropionase-like amidohydrolase